MLIVIEGCMGAGKTTVAKGLCAFRNSLVLLEEFEKNPFLTDFYNNPIVYSTETEFTFLLLHYHQLKSLSKAQPEQEFIADFHLEKDLLYADSNMKNPRERSIFRDLYQLLNEQVAQPNLLVCLSASTELLIGRIRERKRDFELKIDPAYYARINAAYNELFNRHDGPKITVPMDEWNFIQTPDLYRKLSSMIDEQIESK